MKIKHYTQNKTSVTHGMRGKQLYKYGENVTWK